MDSIGKGIQNQLDLTESQVTEIDLLFRDYNREMFFPIKKPFSLTLHKIAYLRKLILLLDDQQLTKFKKIKRKAKQKQKDRNERALINQKKNIAEKYKVLKLNSTQIDRMVSISNNNKRTNHDIIQEKIRAEFKDELSAKQFKDLELIFNQKNKIILSNKIESIKSTYHYLGLHRDQALAFIELEEKNTEDHKITYTPRFKQLSTINPEIKEILNDVQFQKYEENRKGLLERELISLKRNDEKQRQEIKWLKEKEDFLTTELLPKLSEITNELIQFANQEDLKTIYLLRKQYANKIDNLIVKSTKDLKATYQDYAPNNLRISILNYSHYFINPVPNILAETLDLNTNIFSHIVINENQKQRIQKINQILRMHLIESMERRIKSYVTLLGGVQQAADPTYHELYRLILLDEKPAINIMNMQNRQVNIND